MHVVTFYSYKGGVGRTMALVNVAASLAKRGRKVLIVDFDLEAPGISSYRPFSSMRSKGVVEYVAHYIETAKAPNSTDYISECTLGDSKIWVMPAGQRNREYSARLHAIDWESLYAAHRGYLFFEDLKQQWKLLGFNYVLIDSRTGHTDVGGICTRQLPDAVVLMFFPNEQNLVGLESVAKDIREEPKNIALHFCASNVPDLDDEEHILERKLLEAKERLSYASAPILLHHYSSLTLLEQSIFVLDRPESRLAIEYGALVKTIASRNLEDSEGAISILQELRDEVRSRSPEDGGNGSAVRETLVKIKELHPNNPDISWLLASIYNSLGDLENEADCLTTAIESDEYSNRARRRRATIARLQDRQEDALEDLKAIISDSNVTSVEFIAAVELLREIDPNWISSISESRLLSELDPEQAIRLSEMLMSDQRGNELVISILTQFVRTADPQNKYYHSAVVRLVLAQISSGQFIAAMSEMVPTRAAALRSDDIILVFNYAMAEWGAQHSPPRDLMARALELAEHDDYRGDSNRHQCFALANYICGNISAARLELERAKNKLARVHRRIFSCWQYLELTRSQMSEDLNAMSDYLNGADKVPPVLARAWGKTH